MKPELMVLVGEGRQRGDQLVILLVTALAALYGAYQGHKIALGR